MQLFSVGKCRYGRLEDGGLQACPGGRPQGVDGEGGGFRHSGRAISRSSMRHSKIIPPLMEQNSSDLGNEEWETASESSDVLVYRDSKAEEDSGTNRDTVGSDYRKETKKNFSGQRPGVERQNRPGNFGSYGIGSEDLNTRKHGGISGRGGGSSGSRGPRQGNVYREKGDASAGAELSPGFSSSSQNK